MSAVDVMTCVLAREIGGDDVVGVGLGTPLAVCAALVARRSGAPNATIVASGAVSPDATLLECLDGPRALVSRTVGFIPHLDTMDMAERQSITLQFLRPAQVGPDGSANTSRVTSSEGLVRFPGAMATGDVASLLPRVVYYHTAHGRRALPTRVSFRTAGGGGITRAGYTARGPVRLVTDRCVIAFHPDGPRLLSVHEGNKVDDVVAATGFELEVASHVSTTPGPTAEESNALAEVDPHRLRELEFRDRRDEASDRLRRARTAGGVQ